MSYALDLTEGQPRGPAARSCLLGMRIAGELRLSAGDRSDLFYALLMKDAGCSSNAARVSQPVAIRAMDEHWDGGGYPEGLHRDEIPLYARIVGLA